jgi:hypothetical protein
MQLGLQHLLLTTVHYVLLADFVLTGLQTAGYSTSRAVGSLCTDRTEDCRSGKVLLFVVV